MEIISHIFYILLVVGTKGIPFAFSTAARIDTEQELIQDKFFRHYFTHRRKDKPENLIC
jgi:hypothetical protein